MIFLRLSISSSALRFISSTMLFSRDAVSFLKETKDDHTYNLQIDALDEFAASLTDTLENSTKSFLL